MPFFGYERLCVLQTVSRQLVCDAVIRMRGNLINHGQREGILLEQEVILILGDEAATLPCAGHVTDSTLQTGAVIRAVIQRNECQRRQTGAAALEAQCGQLAEEGLAAFRTVLAVVLVVRQKLTGVVLDDIALLGQRKAVICRLGAGKCPSGASMSSLSLRLSVTDATTSLLIVPLEYRVTTSDR